MAQKESPAWRLVTEYDVANYQCGLRAGDRIALKQDLPLMTHDGKPTGTVHERGSIWTVLHGTSQDPVLFLRDQNGERHTWDDDASIFETFDRVID